MRNKIGNSYLFLFLLYRIINMTLFDDHGENIRIRWEIIKPKWLGGKLNEIISSKQNRKGH